MVKVLMLGNDKTVNGGITSVISQLLSYDWRTSGIDMKFIPTYIEANLIKQMLFFFRAYCKIIKEILINTPEVIHMHMSYKGSFERACLISLLCTIFRIRKVVHLHGSEFSKWYDSCGEMKQRRIARMIKSCDAFIVLGKEWEKRIKEIESDAKIIVVNNTVNIPQSTCVGGSEKKKILFLGVFIPRKGVKDLLDAIAYLNDNNLLEKNVKVVLAGSGKDEKKLRNQVCQLKIGQYVEFAGWIDESKKKKLFLESNMLVLPSYNEGLPMAVLEAMSYGLPIVATNVGDMSEAVIEGENGYLVEPGNVQQLSDAILKILRFDQNKWYVFSSNSRLFAERKFSDRQYKDLFVGLYNSLQQK